jgi:hypothetical protein
MLLKNVIKMMQKSRLLPFLYLLPLLFVITLTTFYLSNRLDNQLFLSLLYGFLFPTLNFLLGILSIHFGFEKSDKLFLIIVFGGLIIRFFVMLILIVVALKLLFVSLNSFIFTTFIFYFYYLIVEIFILTRKKNLIIKTKQ